jgi:cytochrome P450
MLIMRRKNPIKLYEDTFNKYGDIVYFRLGPYHFAMLNDADAFEQVLQTESKNFTKSTGYQRFKMIVGDGLLVSEGEKWRKQRRLLSWAFSSKNIEKIYPLIMKETVAMIERWKTQSKLDLAEEMNLITLQVISISLFGKSQLSGSHDIRKALQEMLTYLQTTRHLWIQLLLSPFPIKDKRGLALKIEASLPTKKAKTFFSSIKLIDKLVHAMIEERKVKAQNDIFLDTLIQATDSEDQTQMDNQQLRDEVVNMLIAGHETTANALTWTWHQLLKHPEVFSKVREEISSIIKQETPKFEDLHKLIYTKAVLEESMRLYPPFWRISRKNIQAQKIGGFDFPPHTNVITSIYTIQRHSKYWKDALKFSPERFLNNEPHHRFAFIPFGAGPRACIGAQFAMTEALAILAMSIKYFQFEADFIGDPEYFMSLTLQPKDGCKVKIKKASS